MSDTPRRSPTGRRRDEQPRSGAGALAHVALFGLGVVVMAIMAVAAHSLAYFPGDVAISHAVQSHRSDWLDVVFGAVSWIGFPPQSQIFFGLIVVLVLVKSRWAAVMEAMAALGSGALYLLLEPVVGQPRPSADLVRVVSPIQMTGFPSGHMATFTAVFGFLAYLGYRRLGPLPTRWLPVAGVAALLVLVGVARIYAGHHWASDVLAGCLLGLLWLAVVTRLYVWGETQFARRRASRAPADRSPGAWASTSPSPDKSLSASP